MSVIVDAFSNAGQRTRTAVSEHQEWQTPETPRRDPKKFFLVLGLGVLSWVATYVGMLELIEANMGELPLVHKLIIGFSVAMLMTMIVWLLDQMFAPIGFFTRTIYAAGYVFLSVISVGFGFGFYWKVLESRSESSRSAESAVTQVQGALNTAATRLEQLQGTLVSLTAISTQKAEQERANGTSCPNSKPGEGPRRKMREDDAARFQFASEFVKGRVTAVKGEMAALDGDLIKIVKDDKSTIDSRSGTRNDFMRALSRKLDMTVTGFNAFRTDPQLKQIRADLAERADKTTITDGKGGAISCPDPQLQGALKGVVRAIDQLPELQKPTIAAVEGAEATIEAFRRLTASFYGLLSFKAPPSADEMRALQQKAIQSVESPTSAMVRNLSMDQAGLSKRDYVPLAIAIFVDICLLLVSMGRPMNRLQGLVPKMQAAERGPVYQILSRFTDIHGDADMRQKFEIFRHVVFDYGGDYYVAVPLDSPRNRNPKEQQELLLEAHLLSNLFSSFEKEKIFKRVYSPLLRTASIQKKLGRQGSKFAHCRAFRVYRFADGAWSEIILGAVMGAAKRVESEKRRLRNQEAAAGRHDSQLPVGRHPAPYQNAYPAARQGEFAGLMSNPTPTMPQRAAAPNGPMGQNQPYAPHMPLTPQPRAMPPRAATVAAFQYAPASTQSPQDDAAAAFGPYADFQQPADPYVPKYLARREAQVANWSDEVARREAEVTVKAANSNTAPATTILENIRPAAMTRSLPVTPMPSKQNPANSGDVDIELTRETMRYTLPAAAVMPTSEAILPASLARLGLRDSATTPSIDLTARVKTTALADTTSDVILLDSDNLLVGDVDNASAADMASKFARRAPAE